MRYIINIIFAAIALLFLTVVAQADTITPKDALANLGTTATVEGVVSQVSTIKSGNTFINFGGRHPNHSFYGIIFGSDANKFGNVNGLEGKTVSINGKIELHKGKPQIILRDRNQIKLVQ